MTYEYPELPSDSENELENVPYYEALSPKQMAESLGNQMMQKLDMMMALMGNMKEKIDRQEEKLEKQAQTIEILKQEKIDSSEVIGNVHMDNMEVEKTSEVTLQRPHRTGELREYNGERSEWIAWRTGAQTKLRIDGKAIGNAEEQFGYLYMHLSTTAQKRIQQWYNLRLKMGTDCTPFAFFERAEGTFGDPNERKNALTLLETIKQKSDESFSDYITKFEEVLAQAGGEDWNMDLQVNALEKSLNKEMQSRLVSYPLVDPSYNTFRAACLTIDAKLQAIRAWDRSNVSRPNLRIGSNNARDDNHNIAPRHPSQIKPKERAPWASAEERERRRQLGLCLRCGNSNHKQKGCNFRSAVTSDMSGRVAVNAVASIGEIENPRDSPIIQSGLGQQGNA